MNNNFRGSLQIWGFNLRYLNRIWSTFEPSCTLTNRKFIFETFLSFGEVVPTPGIPSATRGTLDLSGSHWALLGVFSGFVNFGVDLIMTFVKFDSIFHVKCGCRSHHRVRHPGLPSTLKCAHRDGSRSATIFWISYDTRAELCLKRCQTAPF